MQFRGKNLVLSCFQNRRDKKKLRKTYENFKFQISINITRNGSNIFKISSSIEKGRITI